MDVVLIFNGLGNQMSQYALYYRKKSEGQNVRYICLDTAHNGIELERLFGVRTKMNCIDKLYIVLYHVISTAKCPLLFGLIQKLLNLCHITVLRENGNYSYREDVVIPAKHGIRFLSGGWHNSQYFDCVKEDLKKLYVFPQITDSENLELLEEIKKIDSVAIHIRRGDYMDERYYSQFGSVCTQKYLENAISEIEKVCELPKYFVFSNDKDYSTSLLEGKNVAFVDCNSGINSWKDMVLMGMAKYFVIANSTFSWWAAWLSSDNTIIYCPPFFVNGDYKSDIFLTNWKRVSNV